jgi:hypothetical protein
VFSTIFAPSSYIDDDMNALNTVYIPDTDITRPFCGQQSMRQRRNWVPSFPMLPTTSWSAYLLEQVEAGLRTSTTGFRPTTIIGTDTLLARCTKLVSYGSCFHARPLACTDLKFAYRTQFGFRSCGRGPKCLRPSVRVDGKLCTSVSVLLSLDLMNNCSRRDLRTTRMIPLECASMGQRLGNWVDTVTTMSTFQTTTTGAAISFALPRRTPPPHPRR